MSTTETTTTETTYTCPETGLTIRADGLPGEYGSRDHSQSAEIRLVLRENAEHWVLQGNDLSGGDTTPFSEWHGRDIVVPVWEGEAIVIDDGDLPGILADAAKDCAYLHNLAERHEIDWDGNNYVGRFAFNKDEFLDVREELECVYGKPLSDLSETLSEMSRKTWSVSDWAYEYLTELDDAQLRDPKLEDELRAEAKGDNVRLMGSVQDVVDEILEDREDDDAPDTALHDPSRTPSGTQGEPLDAGAAPD